MGKVGGSVENGAWDRAGVPMKAEGAVIWLATSKDPVLPSTCPAANINHHMCTRQNKP